MFGFKRESVAMIWLQREHNRWGEDIHRVEFSGSNPELTGLALTRKPDILKKACESESRDRNRCHDSARNERLEFSADFLYLLYFLWFLMDGFILGFGSNKDARCFSN